MKPGLQSLFTLPFILIFGLAIWWAKGWPLQARLFPWAIGIPMLFLGLLNVVFEWKAINGKASSRETPVDLQFTQGIDAALVRQRTINILSWVLGFSIGIWLLGFQIGIPLLMFLHLKVQSRESWLISVLLAAFAWFLLWGLFAQLLSLPLTKGLLHVFFTNLSR